MSSFFVRKVHNGRFRNLHNVSARGDFINMANAFDILVHGCDIADCGRNGITLGGQRGLEWSHNVEIDSCVFRSDIDTQMIDLELHGKGTATRSQLNRNVHVHHCQFEAQSPDDERDMDQFAIVMNEVLDFTIDHCDILGPVITRNAEGRLHDNSGGIPQFTMDRDSQVDIRRTRFDLASKMRDANRKLAGIYVSRRDNISPKQFTLVDCDIKATDAEMATAIEIRDCHDVLISDNRLQLRDATKGLYLHAGAHDMSARVHGNVGGVFESLIVFAIQLLHNSSIEIIYGRRLLLAVSAVEMRNLQILVDRFAQPLFNRPHVLDFTYEIDLSLGIVFNKSRLRPEYAIESCQFLLDQPL